MPKITDSAYGDLTSYLASFLLIGHDPTEGSTSDQTKRLSLSDLKIMMTTPASGMMINGKLNVTVVSSDLVVKILTLAGADPSASDPVLINIAGTLRTVSAATSCTLADGTNWMDLGGTRFATLEQQLFVYAIWDSNSSVVAVAPARFSHGRLVSDFSATTTDEKYIGNYANYTSTDQVANIGLFAATLSAGAAYTWTVPTFTNVNLRHEPTFETDWMTWLPASSAGGSLTYGSVTYPLARYRIMRHKVEYELCASGTLGGTASTNISFTLPFEATQSGLTDPPLLGLGWASDTNVSCTAFLTAGTPDLMRFFKYNLGNFNTSGTCTLRSTGFYEI